MESVAKAWCKCEVEGEGTLLLSTVVSSKGRRYRALRLVRELLLLCRHRKRFNDPGDGGGAT